jgi:quercetin dioxygenase-like cupin family protein
MTARLTSTLLGGLAAAFLTAASSLPATAQAPAHVMDNLTGTKWGTAPPMLPPGAQIAVVNGDPTKAVPYTVRLKFPANYLIPAHSHPGDENVAIVSGEFFMGMGNKLDKQTGMRLGVGGYAFMPANANHFAYTKGEATILLYGHGPVDFKYVNPSDDPRHTTKE